MSLPDPMPRELTIKQVAERWMMKYGNPVDESYVLGCYGELQFCTWDIGTASFVDYSRKELIGRVAEENKNEENVVFIMGEFLKNIPEFEKEMLRVRKSDLLAFEQLSRQPEESNVNIQVDQVENISEPQARTHELHELIAEKFEELGRPQKNKPVWMALKELAGGDGGIIQEIKSNVIYWMSSWGVEQKMSRKRHDNFLGELRQRK